MFIETLEAKIIAKQRQNIDIFSNYLVDIFNLYQIETQNIPKDIFEINSNYLKMPISITICIRPCMNGRKGQIYAKK